MVARMLSVLVAFQSIVVPGSCCGKEQEEKMGPSYHVYPNDTLPSDLQITAFLVKSTEKRFYYAPASTSTNLSLTLTTCSAPVAWSFAPDNATAPSFLTSTTSTRHFPPPKGGLTLRLLAQGRDTLVHVYVSTEPGGPQALQKTKSVRIRTLKRKKGRSITVKWNPSLVDPQGTAYCIITTTSPVQTTLCAAQSAASNNAVVTCTGSKTQHAVTGLLHGHKYYFSVWAINHQSNFTYPYGKTSTVYDGRFRHTSLKDGKPAMVNLKRLDGKAVFKYKVSDNSSRALDLVIVPCGGVIDVEVALQGATIVRPTRVESYERLTIVNPVAGGRYYVKIFALNLEELMKSSGVEVYATTKYPKNVPLPTMPTVLTLREYASLTTCDSVTVGWMVVPSEKPRNYCISATQGKIKEMEGSRLPNQCGLEDRLNRSADFAVKYCTDIKPEVESAIVHKIDQLRPNRHYIIQVTVKKPQGRMLSYELLQVRTRRCKKKNLG